jgi:chorismate synthase
MKGSEHNDLFNANGSTRTNLSGGIQGGISNGMDIYFELRLSPWPQLCKTRIIRQYRCNYWQEKRHDPCVVPRAVPIVEAMAAIV